MKSAVMKQAAKQTAETGRRASAAAGHTGGAPPRSNQLVQRLLRQQEDGETVRLQRQAGGGVSCSPPAECPSDFCTPFPARFLAVAARDAAAPVLLAGIAAKVSPRVAPLWSQYLFGGAPVQDLSGQFGSDFSNSATTASTTDFLADSLKTSLEASPPSFRPGVTTVTVDIPSRIGAAIAEIGNQSSAHPMDFNVIGEIPGNIAGGIGDNQASCPVGAQPSPQDDDRTAAGSATVAQNSDGSLGVSTAITYTVHDTIDLCPGNCGASIEQVATVPMSRMEASGVSGDVPFTVTFAAPARTFTAHPTTAPPAPPVPPGPVTGPITGEITASALRIRQAPDTSSAILGSYPRGTTITIECQTTGTNVGGNATWDRTDRGYVSDRYVLRGPGTPPNC